MADVVLFPCPELPFRPLPVPAVVVVHDVGAVVAPALYGRGKQWRFALDLRRVLRFADHVVCVSHAAERALRSYFGARQTSVIPEGCAMSVPRSKRTPVSPPFALYVGTLQTHKNVETLVRGIARLRSPDLRLVLAGTAAAPERAGFQRLCRELGVADRVTHHGWVGREELSRLYSECSVVVVPSLSEGFGLPLLEAFAHGAPAIASNLSVFHEIGGDTPRYVDEPLSPSAWAHAIDAAVADAAWLSVSERRGIDAAAAFSWRRTAASLRAVCGRVA